MQEENSEIKIGFLDQLRRNKYWFIVSALFFLSAATIYVIYTPPKYKLTSKILLNDEQSTNDVIEDITSKYIVQKTINQLPLKVSYYHNDVPIPEDSLPVKFIVIKNNSVNSSGKFTVSVLDTQQYEIEQNDTISDFYFNKPVNYSSAKFIGVKGPFFSTKAKPFTLKLTPPDQLLEEYYDNLDAKFVGNDHKAIELSLTTTSLNNGKAFLDKLVKVYSGYQKIASATKKNVPANHRKYFEKVSQDLTALKLKAKKFKDEQVTFAEAKQALIKPSEDEKKAELNALNAIQRSAESSVNQSVLIPVNYHLTDSELEKLIARFNKLKLDKQRAFQGSQINTVAIGDINKQFGIVKQAILQRIMDNKNAINNTQSPAKKMEGISAAYSDSLSKINALIKSKQLTYDRLLQNNYKGGKTATENTKQMIVEKPVQDVVTYPKTAYVYLLALLIGLVLPLIAPYFKFRLTRE